MERTGKVTRLGLKSDQRQERMAVVLLNITPWNFAAWTADKLYESKNKTFSNNIEKFLALDPYLAFAIWISMQKLV